MSNELRERLAAYAHGAWAHWMKYMLGGPRTIDGDFVIPKERVDRWVRQMNTEYADLPAEEKPSDRHQADKILEVLEDDECDNCNRLFRALFEVCKQGGEGSTHQDMALDDALYWAKTTGSEIPKNYGAILPEEETDTRKLATARGALYSALFALKEGKQVDETGQPLIDMVREALDATKGDDAPKEERGDG